MGNADFHSFLVLSLFVLFLLQSRKMLKLPLIPLLFESEHSPLISDSTPVHLISPSIHSQRGAYRQQGWALVPRGCRISTHYKCSQRADKYECFLKWNTLADWWRSLSPPPTLFPSSSTGEMAFVLVHSAVHHSGTKRLNQVAWSNSPWGFNATEKRDYSLTALVLQRTPLWYCTMWKPFPNTFPQCKTERAPWDSCHGGRKIQESIRHAPYWSTPPWVHIENVLYVRRMGKER